MSAVGALTKWLVVPVVVGALGYFVFGPRFGGQVASKIQESGVPLGVPSTPTSYPKPKVTVSARKIDGGVATPSDSRPSTYNSTSSGTSYSSYNGDQPQPPRRKRRRRRRTQPRTDTSQPAIAAPADDTSVTNDNPSDNERPSRRKHRRRNQPQDLPPVIPDEQPPTIDDGQ